MIPAHMKMEARKLDIDLKSLYVNEPDLYNDACLPDYMASPILLRTEHYEAACNNSGEGERSPPGAKTTKNLLVVLSPLVKTIVLLLMMVSHSRTPGLCERSPWILRTLSSWRRCSLMPLHQKVTQYRSIVL